MNNPSISPASMTKKQPKRPDAQHQGHGAIESGFSHLAHKIHSSKVEESSGRRGKAFTATSKYTTIFV